MTKNFAITPPPPKSCWTYSIAQQILLPSGGAIKVFFGSSWSLVNVMPILAQRSDWNSAKILQHLHGGVIFDMLLNFADFSKITLLHFCSKYVGLQHFQRQLFKRQHINFMCSVHQRFKGSKGQAHATLQNCDVHHCHQHREERIFSVSRKNLPIFE